MIEWLVYQQPKVSREAPLAQSAFLEADDIRRVGRRTVNAPPSGIRLMVSGCGAAYSTSESPSAISAAAC
jgi:hypothetical protein